jgi:hypothetical protein
MSKLDLNNQFDFKVLEQKIETQEIEKVQILRNIVNAQEEKKKGEENPKTLKEDELFLRHLSHILGFLNSVSIEDISCSVDFYRVLLCIKTKVGKKKIEDTFGVVFKLESKKLILSKIEIDSNAAHFDKISKHSIKLNDLGFFVNEIHGYHHENAIIE